MLKKILALVMACTIALSMGVLTGASAEEEQITVSMMTNIDNDNAKLENNLAWQTFIKDSNITFDIDYVTPSTLSDRRTLALNSGEYADVLWRCGLTETDLANYGSQGIFIDLKDLILQYAPNLAKYLDDNNLWEFVEDINGKVWSLPYIMGYSLATDHVFYNTKWLANVGLTEPTSMDELTEMLRAFKAQDANGNGDAADEVPFSCNQFPQLQQAVANYMFNLYNYQTLTAIDENGELFYAPVTDTWKEFIRYATTWYSEGLMNQDFGEIGWSDWNATGRGTTTIGSFARIAAANFVGSDSSLDFSLLTPFAGCTVTDGSGVSIGGLCITDACEHPERIVALFDYLYTLEGGTLDMMGVKDVDYKLNDDGTYDIIYGDHPHEGIAHYTTLRTNCIEAALVPDLWFNENSPVAIHSNQDAKRVYEMGAVRAKMNYTDEETETVSVLKTEILTYVTSYFTQIVRGVDDLDSTWDAYLATMKDMGAYDLEAIYQAAYTR